MVFIYLELSCMNLKALRGWNLRRLLRIFRRVGQLCKLLKQKALKGMAGPFDKAEA
jgi:hypothetical protein